MRFSALIAVVVTLFSTTASLGHEFWISPKSYVVQPGEPLVAQLRVGQKFDGFPYGYFPPRFARFDVVQGDISVPVESRIGDRPALNMTLPSPGLWVVVHETTDSSLTYSDWSIFEGFVIHKDLGNTLAMHAERGLPQTGFSEEYRRYAKSLIAVGDGRGADREVGLRTEIVAETNPYTDDLSDGVRVRVLLEGEPRADTLVEIFARGPDSQVTVTTTQTDAAGRASFAVHRGHEYLVDAVYMEALYPSGGAPGSVWKSHWAALTFMVPG